MDSMKNVITFLDLLNILIMLFIFSVVVMLSFNSNIV